MYLMPLTQYGIEGWGSEYGSENKRKEAVVA
jgi:hypothetical protein